MATKTAPAKTTAPATADKAAAPAFDFAAIVAAAAVVAVPTAAERARTENPFTDLVAGMLIEGKPVSPENKEAYAASARQITVPGGLSDEPAKKVAYFLNAAGATLGVTVRKNAVQGKNDDGTPATQFTIWAVERQKRERKG